MMPPLAQPTRRRGFTLLETLIAVALLSVILAALYSTFDLSHKAMDGLDESLLGLQECRNTMDMMTREVESAKPYDPTNAANKFVAFKVEDRDLYGKQTSRFTFTTFSPLVPGLSLVSYYVEEKDGKPVLFKKIKSAYSSADVEGFEIMEGIDSFSVEVRDGEKWVKTWDASEAGKTPTEIRLTLTAILKGRPVTLYETLTRRIGSAV